MVNEDLVARAGAAMAARAAALEREANRPDVHYQIHINISLAETSEHTERILKLLAGE